jgi:carbon monoxide dehydrogenase subunit G
VKLVQRCVLAAERERLWDFLVDVPRVARCLPGVEAIEPVGENRYRGVLNVQMGPVRLALGGTLTLEEQDRNAWQASMRAEANDRGAGGGIRARMTARLAPAEAGTEFVVETDLTVLGKIGEFGQPLIKKKADGLIQTFAANVQAALAGAPVSPQRGEP